LCNVPSAIRGGKGKNSFLGTGKGINNPENRLVQGGGPLSNLNYGKVISSICSRRKGGDEVFLERRIVERGERGAFSRTFTQSARLEEERT